MISSDDLSGKSDFLSVEVLISDLYPFKATIAPIPANCGQALTKKKERNVVRK